MNKMSEKYSTPKKMKTKQRIKRERGRNKINLQMENQSKNDWRFQIH